jgi:hypothetical protein
VLSHDITKAGPTPGTGLPITTPSSWNWTLLIPTLLVALAATVMVLDTVAPPCGDPTVTTGLAGAAIPEADRKTNVIKMADIVFAETNLQPSPSIRE